MASGRAGLHRAPETSAAGPAALEIQGWGLQPTGGQRPSTAPRAWPQQWVQWELQPGPRGDPLLGHNLGPALGAGPKSHFARKRKGDQL